MMEVVFFIGPALFGALLGLLGGKRAFGISVGLLIWLAAAATLVLASHRIFIPGSTPYSPTSDPDSVPLVSFMALVVGVPISLVTWGMAIFLKRHVK
jgi:hypothetical protein